MPRQQGNERRQFKGLKIKCNASQTWHQRLHCLAANNNNSAEVARVEATVDIAVVDESEVLQAAVGGIVVGERVAVMVDDLKISLVTGQKAHTDDQMLDKLSTSSYMFTPRPLVETFNVQSDGINEMTNSTSDWLLWMCTRCPLATKRSRSSGRANKSDGEDDWAS
ncbi:hypothetical protein F442_13042 [Phytophthora nicotianae P10297]|uniref:Uncharacterized protein n=1 Tax=Phytophthora nicotianae P10297 TaxID=1317064 RepID=W2YXQ7_PHYNI|nr:hypothetical protein F442_13042 [Phytophthora nicotianae P10297]